MIKLAVVSPNPQTLDALCDALSGIAALDGILQLRQYPELDQIDQLSEASAGSILLLDFTDFSLALKIAKAFDRSSREIKPIAVFSPAPSRDHLMELMQVGIREIIVPPFGRTEICGAVMRMAEKAGRVSVAGMLGEIHAFLPAKPGSGATTVCTSVAAAVARLTNRRTLLLDFDIKLGITSFLLKLNGNHSVADALKDSGRLDDDLWEKLIGQREGLEILGSAPSQVVNPFTPADYSAVLTYAQQIYSAICVDLPGSMEEYEIETLRRAARIYLVCTGDMTALHMAQRKMALLNDLGVLTSLSVILNFAGKRSSLSVTDIEKILQTSVRFTLPADETTVPESVKQGTAISGRSPLATRLQEIAEKIAAATDKSIKPTRAKKFVEFFSVSRARTKFGGSQ